MSTITSLATINPAYRYNTEEIISTAKRLWLAQEPSKIAETAIRIMRAAEIQERFACIPLDTVFAPLSFEEKNNLYIEAVKKMAADAVVKACEKIQLAPNELDAIITTSCTGFMIPSVDAYLINALKMRENILRMPITEMGCAGGTSALTYAQNLQHGRKSGKIAVVCVEAPSVTFQRADFSMENLVSTAIFADGAACAIVDAADVPGIRLLDSSMYHFPDSTHLMGYNLQNSGLKIVLDRDVPDSIASHFPRFFNPILERNKLSVSDLAHFVFHPGGKKIIQQVERHLATYGKNVDASKAVLYQRGNLSSATVLYVLDKINTDRKPQHGELGYMLAFGPGFSAQSLLLRWESKQ